LDLFTISHVAGTKLIAPIWINRDGSAREKVGHLRRIGQKKGVIIVPTRNAIRWSLLDWLGYLLTIKTR